MMKLPPLDQCPLIICWILFCWALTDPKWLSGRKLPEPGHVSPWAHTGQAAVKADTHTHTQVTVRVTSTYAENLNRHFHQDKNILNQFVSKFRRPKSNFSSYILSCASDTGLSNQLSIMMPRPLYKKLYPSTETKLNKPQHDEIYIKMTEWEILVFKKCPIC